MGIIKSLLTKVFGRLEGIKFVLTVYGLRKVCVFKIL